MLGGSVDLARDGRGMRRARGVAAEHRRLPSLGERQSLRRLPTPTPRDELACFDEVESLGLESCQCCSVPRPGSMLVHSYVGRVSTEVCASAIPAGTRNALAIGQQRFEKSKTVPKQNNVEMHTERVTCVLGLNANHYTLNGTNCWLVGTGKQRLLIDTGEHQQRMEFLQNLKDAMAQVGCEGLCAILITHMHGDHTGGIDTLQQEFGPGIPVLKGAVPKHHVRAMEQIIEHGVLEHLQDKVRPRDTTWGGSDPLKWDELGRSRDELKRDFGSIQMHWNNHRKMVDVWNYHELQDDELITIAEGATLRAMHTPGHASDHVAFWLEEEEAIFTGDHVLGYGTTSVMDVSSYMKSIYRMRALRPSHLYPGHGPYVREGIELLNRYILHRTSREQQVIKLLAESDPASFTTREIVDRLYTDVTTEKIRMAMENVQKIVMKLGKDGTAQPLRLASRSLPEAMNVSTAAAGSGSLNIDKPGDLNAHTEGEEMWTPYKIPWYLSMGHELPSDLRWRLADQARSPEEQEDEIAVPKSKQPDDSAARL